jgi:hypothetical protein
LSASRVGNVSEMLLQLLGINVDHQVSVTDSFLKLESFLRLP